jgi:hypothetical protein
MNPTLPITLGIMPASIRPAQRRDRPLAPFTVAEANLGAVLKPAARRRLHSGSAST